MEQEQEYQKPEDIDLDREIELLKFFAEGYTWPEDKRILGKKMDVLPGTLDKYHARIKEKMNIEDNKKVAKVASMHFKAPDDSDDEK